MDKRKVLIVVVSIVLIFILVIYLVVFSSNKKVSSSKESQTDNQNVTSKNENSSNSEEVGIIINKKDVTSTAKFYSYKSGNINMEVIAVKAGDGSIRTSLNTCQVCYDSGRGYYKQEGNYMICQNCGNRFNINQIEKIKGGCNPVPILEENKTDNGDTITISKEFLDSQKSYFENWK